MGRDEGAKYFEGVGTKCLGCVSNKFVAQNFTYTCIYHNIHQSGVCVKLESCFLLTSFDLHAFPQCHCHFPQHDFCISLVSHGVIDNYPKSMCCFRRRNCCVRNQVHPIDLSFLIIVHYFFLSSFFYIKYIL